MSEKRTLVTPRTLPASGHLEGWYRRWIMPESRLEVWHWIIYAMLALLALLAITRPLRG